MIIGLDQARNALDAISPYADHVRRHDPDRFACALTAPPDARRALVALLAFNHEIARVRETASEPFAGAIRLQWWRDLLTEIAESRRVRTHPLAVELAPILAANGALRPLLDQMIDAREFDLLDRPMTDLQALTAYARATGGALHGAMGLLLGAREPAIAPAAAAGTAFALTGILRMLPVTRARGQHFLPPRVSVADVIVEAKLLAEAARRAEARLRPATIAVALLPPLWRQMSRPDYAAGDEIATLGGFERSLRLLWASAFGG